MARWLLLGLVLATAACTSRPPLHDRSGEISYNRRELPPAQGVFTGPSGQAVIFHRRDVETETPTLERCDADEDKACE